MQTDESGNLLAHFCPEEDVLFSEKIRKRIVQDYLLRSEEGHSPILFSSPFFSIAVTPVEPGCFLLLGPCVVMRQAYAVLSERLPLYLPPEKDDRLIRYLTVTPIVSDNRLKSAVSLATSLCGASISPEEILTHIGEPRREAGQNLHAEYVFSAQENAQTHTPFEFEEMICADVAVGDLDAALRHLSGSMPGALGKLSEDPERQARYMFVTATAILCRAAIRGGVHSEAAYSLADSYCQRMDAVKSVERVQPMMWDMLAAFCAAVKQESSQREYSFVIKNCCNYISKHLHDPIMLPDLAEACGMSERRLSEKFFRETGERVGDYIHRQKLREARDLLRYSSMSICDIGNALCYSSQSYFTRKYKEQFGVTPLEERKKTTQ
ncbi:MAG: helix-turn-helix transcriptional regulator [Lachnospiraceae bacterium]|nr:helix-turn-helix transcriptional regulator [Lachnospiraceae bacterium]